VAGPTFRAPGLPPATEVQHPESGANIQPPFGSVQDPSPTPTQTKRGPAARSFASAIRGFVHLRAPATGGRHGDEEGGRLNGWFFFLARRSPCLCSRA